MDKLEEEGKSKVYKQNQYFSQYLEACRNNSDEGNQMLWQCFFDKSVSGSKGESQVVLEAAASSLPLQLPGVTCLAQRLS